MDEKPTQWKSELIRGLIIVVVSVVLTFSLERSCDCINATKNKPNEDRCAIVYYQDSEYSLLDAKTVKCVLELYCKGIAGNLELDWNPEGILKSFELVPQSFNWYRNNFPKDSTGKDFSSEVLVWFNSHENEIRADWVCLKVRMITLYEIEFKMPDSEALYCWETPVDYTKVCPEEPITAKAGLHKYAVVIVIPPYFSKYSSNVDIIEALEESVDSWLIEEYEEVGEEPPP